MTRYALALSLSGFLAATLGGTAFAADAPHAAASAGSKNIVETAQSTGKFTTLLTAAKAAGLVDTLATGGPFTVFAPTDEAFAKLPAGAVDGLLKDKDKLKKVLLYHVVKGKVTAKQVVGMDSAPTLAGPTVEIDADGGTVMINNAKVVKADVMASNGVIHVIDTVLMPPSE